MLYLIIYNRANIREYQKKCLKAWKEYCKSELPSFKKVVSYAAALEYFTFNYYIVDQGVTQNQIANEYGTSPGSVSSNYRKLENALNLKKPYPSK